MSDLNFAALADNRLTPVNRVSHQQVRPTAMPSGKINLPYRQLDNPVTVPAGTIALQSAVDARFIKQNMLIILYFRYTPLVGGGSGSLTLNLPFPGSATQPYAIGIIGDATSSSLRTVAFDARTRALSFAIPTFGNYYELQLEYETDYDG